MSIHPTFNFVPCSQSKSRHASSNHHRPIIMLHSSMDMLRSSTTFSISNPKSWPTIWVEPIYLCLVTENHAFPIINGPISYLWANLKRARTCLQKWLPLLHLCTPSNLYQSTPHSDFKQQYTFKWSCFVVANEVPTQPSITRVTQRLFSQSARSFEHPPLCLSISPPTSFLQFAIEDWLMPTKTATLQLETPILSCTKAWCFYSWDNGGIQLQMILQIAPHVLWNQGYRMHTKMSMLEDWRRTNQVL